LNHKKQKYYGSKDILINFMNTASLRAGPDPRFNIHSSASFHGEPRFDWVSFRTPSGDAGYGQTLVLFSIVGDLWIFLRSFKEISVLSPEMQRPAIIESKSIFQMLSPDLEVTRLLMLPINCIIRCEHISWIGTETEKRDKESSGIGIVNTLVYSPIFSSSE